MKKNDKNYFKNLGKLLDEHAPPVYPKTPEEFIEFIDEGWAFFKGIKKEPVNENTALEFYKKWMKLNKNSGLKPV